MHALLGPYLAAASLLVLAGGQKVVDPAPLVRALRSLGLPGGRRTVRLVAAGEVVLGLMALLTSSRLVAVGVGVSYLAFTGIVLRGLWRGGVLASCGCFGKADTPPTRTHAAVTAALGVAALVVVPAGPGALTLALLVTSAALAVTAYLTLAVLPLLSARPA